MKYIVKKRNKTFNIINIKYPFKGFKFKSKNDSIKDLTVVNDELIQIILNAKINNMFIRLLMIVNDAFNSDDNPSGTQIALDEILLVKNTIKNKYAKYLEKEQEELYYKKLKYIEEEIKYKKFYIEENSYLEQKGHSR